MKAIRRAEPVSRTQLVAMTGLSAGTISELTSELLRHGIVLDEKEPSKGRGRPRVQLRLNPDAAFVAGVFVFPNSTLEVGLTNLRGDKVFSKIRPIPLVPSVQDLAMQIAILVDETIADSPLEKSAIHSVGVGLPATVNSVSGEVHWLQYHPAPPVPFAAIIGEYLNLPVFLDNTADVVARAEHWFGEDRQLDDFCLVMLGMGLSFAQYVEGMLWTSPRGLNSEFSHLKVVGQGGPRCVCGATGCLMTYCSMYGIVSQVSMLRGLDPPPYDKLEDAFEIVAEQARCGDKVAIEVFDRAGTALGTCLANHVNVWDPGRIIVLCANPTLSQFIKPRALEALRSATFPAFADRVSIEFRIEGEDQYSKGSAALVLEQIYRVAGRRSNRR
ncbi:ROK family transcriptional regulator [Novosphingobium sp.]|uniref:ROK family transcriptional regulator n=1 Tax=Novosphingobium sp. TaxID=1874826 RepID=UPI0025DC2B54|nr:ROK family transcriptional regulator [Novosphingobium sp.]